MSDNLSVILIGLLICYIVVYSIYQSIVDYFKRFCPHKIYNGYQKKLCPECKKIKDGIEAKEAREVKLKEILSLSYKLSEKEYFRLHNLKKQRAEALYELSPQQFEDAVADLYRNLGYQVKQTPYSNDGGKDAIAWKNGRKYLIECKRYEASKQIGRPMIQKFFAAMVEEKADKGFFVSTSKFTDTAYEYVKDKNIELVHGTKLADLFRTAFPNIEDNPSFEQLCLECGDSVHFQIIGIDSMACKNGHVVLKSIPKSSTNNYQHKKRRNNGYRR